MTVSKPSAEFLNVPTNFLWRSVNSVCCKSSAIPSTPFIGVRISWLILARNNVLAWFASWASSRATASSFVR